MRRKTQWLACVAGVLALAGAAQAQQRIGGGTGGTGGGFTGGGGTGGGFTGGGGTGGGFTGGTGGGFTGGGGTGGGFTGGGGTGGGFTGGGGGGGGRGGLGGTATYGRSSILGPYYSNPLSAGYGVTSGAGGGSSFPALTSSRDFSVVSPFGQPLGGQTTALGRTGQLGGQLGGGGLGGQLGGGGLGGGSRALGASSIGVRRAPAYLTSYGPSTAPVPALDPAPYVPQYAPQRVSTAEVQRIVTASPQFAAGAGVTVTTANDGAVVLRGSVTSERDRRMAEARALMAPAVGQVRNEITVTPPKR